jgi:hypothetical protein
VLEFFWSMGVPLREATTDAGGFPTVTDRPGDTASSSPSSTLKGA